MIIPPPSSSLVLTNLFSLLCRLIACDKEYDYPPVSVEPKARSLDLENVDSNGYSNNIVDPIENLEVLTKTGKIRGYYMKNVRGQDIRAFEGIPFAEPPVNEKRFKPPVPKKPWNGTLMAHNPGSPCVQIRYGGVLGNEDCLRLNIYRLNANPSKPYPVIVFIHGGFWITGSGQYFGPAYLLLKEVILVTINYRLGTLGFFTTGDEEAPGNIGLRDQVTAIDWIHSNIAMFGGDPSKITVAGQSAGSVSAHLIMISNSPIKHKINNVISMSGNGYNAWGLNRLDTALMTSSHMANVSGCPTSQSSRQVVSCMRQVDANVLVANQLFTTITGTFIPSIEPDTPGAFLSKTPDEAYADGTVAKVPWIITMTSKELNLPVPPLQANLIVMFLRAAISTDIATLLAFRRQGVDERIARQKILQFYTGSDSVNSLSQQSLTEIATDRYFTVPFRKAIQMHSQVAPTYASIFNYTGSIGRAGRSGLNPKDFAPFHGDDLVYFLNSTKNHPPIGRYDSHFAITKLLVNLVANFASFGEPVYETEKNEVFRIWDKIENRDRLRYLWVDEEVKMVDDSLEKVADFWESLGISDTTPAFTV